MSNKQHNVGEATEKHQYNWNACRFEPPKPAPENHTIEVEEFIVVWSDVCRLDYTDKVFGPALNHILKHFWWKTEEEILELWASTNRALAERSWEPLPALAKTIEKDIMTQRLERICEGRLERTTQAASLTEDTDEKIEALYGAYINIDVERYPNSDRRKRARYCKGHEMRARFDDYFAVQRRQLDGSGSDPGPHETQGST